MMAMTRTILKTAGRNDELDDSLYDESAGYDDDTGIRFGPNLTSEERSQATSLYRLFNGLWGVCVVLGDPGTGKDVFGNYLTYKLKRFFPWKRVVRDERPRRLFGPYEGVFDESVIVNSIKNMLSIAKGKGQDDDDDEGIEAKALRLEGAADDWVNGAGQVLLKNSVLYLTEFWRYCYNREPHAAMNKTMGAIHKVKRHLDCLIVGTGQLASELDKKTCLPWIDWRVTCTRSRLNKTGFTYLIQKVKYDRRVDQLMPISDSFPISFDAGKPRSNMGDGRIIIRKHDYKAETDEERIVLTLLKAGVTTFEEMMSVLEAEGDMTEAEVLDTLKELSFNPRKHIVDYPCYFRLFNSKSAPQLKTSLKVSE